MGRCRCRRDPEEPVHWVLTRRDRPAAARTEARRGRAAAGVAAQWVLDRVPYGSVDSVGQAVAGSPLSVKWLLDGPFCAGSLLVQQISGRTARTFCAHSVFLQHPNAEKMRSSCCSSAERSFKSYNARDLAFPPIGSRFRHTQQI